MLKHLVDSIYAQYGLVPPNAEQALVELVRAVGDLADAYLELHEDEMHNGPRMLLRVVSADGAKANTLLRGTMRIGEQKEANISDEVGDVLMTLERFSQAAGCGEPVHCLVRKMQKKTGGE